MSTTQSNYLSTMDVERYGITDETNIEFLEPLEYLGRYIDVVALGDTVLRGASYASIVSMSVIPWGEKERQEVNDRMRETAEEMGFEWGDPEPVRGPLSHEQAQTKVEELLLLAEKQVAYRALTRLQRAKEFGRFLLGKDSCYTSLQESSPFLPNVMTFRERGADHLSTVVINAEADRTYRPFKAQVSNE